MIVDGKELNDSEIFFFLLLLLRPLSPFQTADLACSGTRISMVWNGSLKRCRSGDIMVWYGNDNNKRWKTENEDTP